MLWSLIFGMLVVATGVPIGDFLYKKTREEIKSGQKWFKIIVITGLMGAIAAMFLNNDFLFFSFLFISIVTSRSLTFKK
jgi:hypothetical protein